MKFETRPPKRRTGATLKGTTNAFAKTGKAKPAQFAPKSPGQREVGFKQWTDKQVTAAMQGRPPQGGEVKAKPKNNGSRQFTKAGGKAIW